MGCLTLAGIAWAQTSKPLGKQEHEVGGVEVTLLELKRTSGDTVTARWSYANKTKEPKQLTQERTGWIDPYRLSRNAYLAEGTNRVKYEVMTDTDRRPIASRNGTPNKFIFVAPGQTVTVWAKFQAPPANVNKVTVMIDGVAPFEDVPIAPAEQP